MIEKLAKAIHDTDDMCDTVWPDSDDDTGYRGGSGYVRLCKHPELYRNAARAVLTALREPDEGMKRAGANGYDEARCRINSAAHGGKCAPMSDLNKLTIAPMIGCAITAAIDHILQEADRD